MTQVVQGEMRTASAAPRHVRAERAGHYRATFHDDEIPAFVEAELERLYQSPMTTLARFDIYEAAPHASTYVEREDGRIVTLLLFRRLPRRIIVYNEQVALDAAAIGRFARAVFARYRDVARIDFYAIATDAAAVGYPCLNRECLEDIVLPLPDSARAYLAALGKNTRAEIRRYLGKIRRDFPSFRFETRSTVDVSEEQVRQIIAFNHARLGAKGEVSYYDEQAIARLLRWIRKYGRVGVASIDGSVCAGIICFCVGTHVLMLALAHDPRLDDYRLGKLCCYLSIGDAIEQGAHAYHFGWGRFEYKFRMLGQLHPLYRVELYRSHLSMLRDARHVVQAALTTRIRKLKQRLAEGQAGNVRGGRLLPALAAAGRTARNALRHR